MVKMTKVFTLIEMLVVVAIIGILASMLMPSLRKALDTAKSISCVNNMRQVGIQFTTYVNDNNNNPPPYANYYTVAWLAGYGPTINLTEMRNKGIFPDTIRGIYLCPSAEPVSGADYYKHSYVMTSTNTSPDAVAGGCHGMISGMVVGRKYNRIINGSVVFTEGRLKLQGNYAFGGSQGRNVPNVVNSWENYAGTDNDCVTYFNHDLKANFLYKDGRVVSHQAGTLFDVDKWSVQ